MQKVISLFKRDYEGTRQIYDEIVEGAEWVVEGYGRATEKIDGTSCLLRDGRIYKRYDAKNGKTPPPDFEPAQPEADAVTGHWPGWLPVTDGPEDKWHREGLANSMTSAGEYTCELVGPKVQGNKYGLGKHGLRVHGDVTLAHVPKDFVGIKAYLESKPEIEGIVWHHVDGRMVKIKRRDFGLSW